MNAATRRRLADQLRLAVENSKRSRRDIAKEADVDETSLSKFMAGERGLSLESLESLAEVLQLHLVRRK